MKSGQNVTHKKEAFNHGIKKSERGADALRAWMGNTQDKKDRLNVCRKKSKRK